MIEKNIEQILNNAFREANDNGYEFFTTEHVLLALIEGDTNVQQAFIDLQINTIELSQQLNHFIKTNCPRSLDAGKNIIATSAFHRIIQRTNEQRQSAGKEVANGLHIIISIMDETESHAVYYLKKQQISKLELLQYAANFELDQNGDYEDELSNESASSIESFCENLNELAKNGQIDPLIGREKELQRTIQVLSRRRKNNPILVGESGVGKTAIAEGLAKNIIDGNVPDVLKETTIYSVDLGAMVAGSKYRGDFEKRIKTLVQELSKLDNTVIFIDEIHTLLGAGATSEGTLDAANLLKPALSSGALKCIGATTYQEYHQSFEKNAALARRFQKIDVLEPSTEETYEIIKGLQERFEKFHKVSYSDTAIRTAIDLSAKYLHERFLPDKAIDLIDEAGAKAKIQTPPKKKVNITDIETVLASIAKIPQRTLSTNENNKLRYLERNLKKHIFGQDQAITALTSAIKLAKAGLKDPEKPIGSFLFTGPTGVGKTEVSKQLANEMGVNFLRFDMSEYMESHSVSKLIGSPPGYIGHDKAGVLTDAISKAPHSILLLDEIEKAHPDIYNILLQIMDYGQLTDSNGKVIHFQHVILIMTSNVGAEKLDKNGIGFTHSNKISDDYSQESLRKVFSPEFRNRLTEIIQFKVLTEKELLKIVNLSIVKLQESLKAQNIEISFSKQAKQFLLKKGYNPSMGARPMARVFEQEVKKPLSEQILFGSLKKGGEVTFHHKKGDASLSLSYDKEIVKA